MEFTPDGRWYRLSVGADGRILRLTNRDYDDKNAGLYEAVDDIIGEGNAPLGPGPGIALATDGDGNDCKRAMAYKPEFSAKPRTSNVTGGRAVPADPPF